MAEGAVEGAGAAGEGAAEEGEVAGGADALLGGDVAPVAEPEAVALAPDDDEDAGAPSEGGGAVPPERASPRTSRASVTAAAPARLSQVADSRTRVWPSVSVGCRTVRVSR